MNFAPNQVVVNVLEPNVRWKVIRVGQDGQEDVVVLRRKRKRHKDIRKVYSGSFHMYVEAGK